MTAPMLDDQVARATRNTLGDALARAAAHHGTRDALLFRDRHWSFVDLDRAASHLAHHLLGLGLQPGDRVAAYGKNSDVYLMLWLACTRAGLIHVPLNFSLVERELVYALNQSGARALLFDPALADAVTAVIAQTPVAHSAPLQPMPGRSDDLLTVVKAAPADVQPPALEQADTDVVQILYTSGTTSDPKGAMHTHRSLLTEYASCQIHLDIRSSDRALAALPLYHSAQMHVFTLPTLLAGGTTWLVDDPSPANLIALLRDHRLNAFFAPPTVWIALLRHADFDPAGLSALTKLYYGASIMPEPIVHELAAKLPAAGLYNCYGQSEIAPLATVLRPEDHTTRPASAGRPIQSVVTRILHPDTGADCAPGEHGEIVHRSPQLMVGYWQNPDATAKAFKDGWFHSGDLGYRDEQGFLFIVDRINDVINTGGVLVASRDVEEVLYSHPQVAEVAVIGLPDERWVEAVCAVIVVKAGQQLSETELADHARAALAHFKVPKRWFFAEALPKNTAGKVLKRALRQQYQ
ncbi:fatty acyl-CoA synthetase [Isoalcanivorax beigongshangi]|uniref:Fatty acyl-CoA synthetase n=1 Tax=Isoalcanivorax beigongshangi TaxID=3238810 RepID=A0ABV4ACD3_9GAMM